MAVEWIVFIGLSTLVFLKFRKELRSFRQHGPYMFVAAEGLLALFVLNGGAMLDSPFTVRQLVSWALMILSAVFAVGGFYGLKTHGRAVQNWENTTRLVHEGLFKYIRHPLYGSLMLLSTGVLLKDVSLQASAAWILTLSFLVVASRMEEGENEAKFGAAYASYSLRTKRYLPFVI